MVKKIIGDAVWETFVDVNIISNEILEIISNRIKEGEELTDREISIYQEYSEFIEEKITECEIIIT